jgi:hypothetical protein
MALAVLLGVGLAVVAALALRDPVFLKLGLRNLPRRRARSVLIVIGLMLGTAIIAAALATGDTMSSTIRSYVTQALGPTDVVVSKRGTDAESIWNPEAASERGGWFAESAYQRVRNATASPRRSSRPSASRTARHGRTSRGSPCSRATHARSTTSHRSAPLAKKSRFRTSPRTRSISTPTPSTTSVAPPATGCSYSPANTSSVSP